MAAKQTADASTSAGQPAPPDAVAETRPAADATSQAQAVRRGELRPGWHVPEHLDLPPPTYWPAALAFGITLLAWGLITSYIIIGIGLIIVVVALAGWIGELLHEH